MRCETRLLLVAISSSVLMVGCANDSATISAPRSLSPSVSLDRGEGGSGDDGHSSTFTLTSTSFKNGAAFPRVNYCTPDLLGGGIGTNVSPPLAWAGTPDETAELALVLDDPDAIPAPSTFTHWITWGIGGERSSLKSGQNGPKVGSNDLFFIKDLYGIPASIYQNYFGPCPPPNTGIHHYTFHLYALKSHLFLKAGATRADFDAAIKGRVIKEADLMGTVNTALPF